MTCENCERLEAQAAAMREVLQNLIDSGWSFNEFENSWGVVMTFHRALESTAGADLLARLERAEAELSAAKIELDQRPIGFEYLAAMKVLLAVGTAIGCNTGDNIVAKAKDLQERLQCAEAERVDPVKRVNVCENHLLCIGSWMAENGCLDCNVHKYHQYLRDHGHIREVEQNG